MASSHRDLSSEMRSDSDSDEVHINYFNPNFSAYMSPQTGSSSSSGDVFGADNSKAQGDFLFKRPEFTSYRTFLAEKNRAVGDKLSSNSETLHCKTEKSTTVPEKTSWDTARTFVTAQDMKRNEILDADADENKIQTTSLKSQDEDDKTFTLSKLNSSPVFTNDEESEDGQAFITETISQLMYSMGSLDNKAIGATMIQPSRSLCLNIPKLESYPATNVLQPKTFQDSGFAKFNENAWNQINQPEKPIARDLVLNIIRQGLFPDVKVFVGKIAKFTCHSIVLKSYSELCMEIPSLKELYIPDNLVSSRGFERAYEWMLNDKALLQLDGIVEAYQAAKFLRMPKLSQQIWIYLDDLTSFREETACFTFLAAKVYNDLEITEVMLRRIQNFFIVLVASPEFQTLTEQELIILLSSELLGINSEIEIFLTAALWLNYKWPSRKKFVAKVMKAVRFSELPTLYIVNLHTKTHVCPELEEIIADPEVQQMIYEGFMHGHLKNSFNNFHGQDDSSASLSRQWQFDAFCSYHHHVRCVNRHLVTYSAFVKHLKKVNLTGAKYFFSSKFTPANNPKIVCCEKPMFRVE